MSHQFQNEMLYPLHYQDPGPELAPAVFQEKALVPEILQVQNLKFLFPDKMFQTEFFLRTGLRELKTEVI